MTLKNTFVFVGNNCSGCIRVLDYLKRTKTKCNIKDIQEAGEPWNKRIFAIPALVVNKKLIAYGEDDIVKYLQSL